MNNGISKLMEKVVNFMEHNDVLTELNNERWFIVENGICNFVTSLLNINEDDKILSNCNDIKSDESPSEFELKIYYKVVDFFIKEEIKAVIYNNENLKDDDKFVIEYNDFDIQKLINSFKFFYYKDIEYYTSLINYILSKYKKEKEVNYDF